MNEYLLDWNTAEYVCPNCDVADGLYENGLIPASRDVTVTVAGTPDNPRPEVDADYPSVELDDYSEFRPDGEIQCSLCFGFVRTPEELKLKVERRVGWDGNPIKAPLPGQECLL